MAPVRSSVLRIGGPSCEQEVVCVGGGSPTSCRPAHALPRAGYARRHLASSWKSPSLVAVTEDRRKSLQGVITPAPSGPMARSCAGGTTMTAKAHRPRESSPRSARDNPTPAESGPTSQSRAGGTTTAVRADHPRGSSPRLALAQFTPAACGLTAPSSAGEAIVSVRALSPLARSSRSARETSTHAACAPTARLFAGARTLSVRADHPRGSSPRLALVQFTPAACGLTAPSSAGENAKKRMSKSWRFRRGSRLVPRLFPIRTLRRISQRAQPQYPLRTERLRECSAR
jgi:hypothetical protein